MRRFGQEPDRWTADVCPSAPGDWTFQIEAWGDPIATWEHAAEIKLPAGLDVELVSEEGARLFERAAAGLPKGAGSATGKALLQGVATTLRDPAVSPESRLAAATRADVRALLARHPLRELLTTSARYPLRVDRERALYGSWYEFFPRSEGAVLDPTGKRKPKSGTFRTAMARLPAVAGMGFDVVYLPPIHPIGRSHRKGPNNTLTPGPHDPGVPWAIGSAEGGHDAIHPELGTLDDFDAFVARARELGLEIALDYALQASPDHPWVTKHPDWFSERADGSIAYAENPPKKYQDIYPLNFDRDYCGPLRREPPGAQALDGPRRADLPRRQPAHQAGALLGVADRRGALDRPRRRVPRRGLHAAGDDASAGCRRLPPVLHVLHLAHREVGAGAVLRPARPRDRPRVPTRTASSTRRTSSTPPSSTAGRRSSRSGLRWPPRSPRAGGSTPATSSSSTWPCDPGARSTSTPRSTTTGRATGHAPRPRGARSRRTSPASTRSAGRTRPCAASATSPSTTATATRSSATPSAEDDDVVLCVVNLDPHGTRETTVRLDMPALGLDWARRVPRARRADRVPRTTGRRTTTSGWTPTRSRPTCCTCGAST